MKKQSGIARPSKLSSEDYVAIAADARCVRPGRPFGSGHGLDRAIEKGWLVMHESGTYLRFTQAGADLFA
jgi:hypothetical protein